ncbi:MAG: PilZ domain-containing protein [Spongiibacteraceae bacterium]
MTQFNELKLLPGAAMRIALAGASAKQSMTQGKYIGSDMPRAIIAAAQVGADLQVGAKVAVSMTSPTGIVTFASQIEAIGSAPFPHVFLQYPRAVNLRNVRSAVRVSVDVSAQVTNFSAEDHLEMHPAHIADISVRGLKLSSSAVLGNVGDELGIHMYVTLDDIVRDVMLTGIIRTRASVEGGETCGVEFTQLDENKRVLLYAYVFNMVQRNGPQT